MDRRALAKRLGRAAKISRLLSSARAGVALNEVGAVGLAIAVGDVGLLGEEGVVGVKSATGAMGNFGIRLFSSSLVPVATKNVDDGNSIKRFVNDTCLKSFSNITRLH